MALTFPKHSSLTLVLLLSAKLFLLLSFSSCTPKTHPQQTFLHEIDSLQKQLMSDSIAFQELLQKPHEGTIRQMQTLLSQTLENDPFFESRTSQLESGLMYFQQLAAESGSFLEEINYSAEPLRNLRHDIDQGVLDKQDAGQYLRSEANAVKQISAKKQYFLNSHEANLLLIETLEKAHQAEKD